VVSVPPQSLLADRCKLPKLPAYKLASALSNLQQPKLFETLMSQRPWTPTTSLVKLQNCAGLHRISTCLSNMKAPAQLPFSLQPAKHSIGYLPSSQTTKSSSSVSGVYYSGARLGGGLTSPFTSTHPVIGTMFRKIFG
jgi:hypothetical protein